MRSAFHHLLAAQIVSIFGDWSFRIAILIIVYELTGSALMMSAAVACSLAPYVLMLPIGGVIADRLPRRTILCWGDFLAGLCCVAIAGYLALGGHSVNIILPGLFALGLITAVYHPALQGFVPSVVDRDALPRANSLFTASEHALNLIGPMLSGGLVAALSPDRIIWLNAASYLISGGLIAAIKVPFAVETTTPLGATQLSLVATAKLANFAVRQLRDDLVDGFRIAWSQPIVRWGTLLFILENFATNLVVGNLIFLLIQELTLPAAAAGGAIGLAAAGAVAGSLLAPALMRRFPSGPLMLACVFAVMGGTLVMLLAPRVGVVAVVLGRGLIMAAEAVIVVTMFTLRQRVIPGPYLGRTIAITRTISAAPVPLGAMAGGYMLTQLDGDISALAGASALLLLVCGVGGLFTPIARAERAICYQDPPPAIGRTS